VEKSALSGVIHVNQTSSAQSHKSATNVLTIARANPRRDSGLPAAAKSWTAKTCGRAERSATPTRVKNSACASRRSMGAKRWKCAGTGARLCWAKRRLGCGGIGRGMVGRRHEAKAAILITIADAKRAKQTNCAQNGGCCFVRFNMPAYKTRALVYAYENKRVIDNQRATVSDCFLCYPAKVLDTQQLGMTVPYA